MYCFFIVTSIKLFCQYFFLFFFFYNLSFYHFQCFNFFIIFPTQLYNINNDGYEPYRFLFGLFGIITFACYYIGRDLYETYYYYCTVQLFFFFMWRCFSMVLLLLRMWFFSVVLIYELDNIVCTI